MRCLPIFAESPVSFTARAGQCLLARDTVPFQATYLQHGRIAAGHLEGDSLRHRILTLQGPSWLEVGSVLFSQPCTADWVAETDVDLLRVPGAVLRNWFAEQPPSVRTLVGDTARLQRLQSESALALMVKDAEARCAEWLLQHARVAEQGQVAVTMTEPKRAIAAQLGIAPETLSRVLRRLRELGLISQSGSVMNLIDPGRLQALAAG